VIFSFASLGERVAAWRSYGPDTDFRWVPVEKPQLDLLTRRLRRLLSSPSSAPAEIQESGLQLKEALFGDWLRQIPADEPLVIQIDDALANVAFGALPGSRDSLGIEHPVSITRYPLPTDGPDQRELPLSGRLLILDASAAKPAWAPDLPVLPSAEREVAAIQRLNGSSAEVIHSEDATVGALIRELPHFAVFHFAGHAIVTGNGIALVLSGADFGDRLFDLNGASTWPRMVVLSACSTGVAGEETDAGDPDSLTTAFLQKGSREVIASLWNVDSDSTAELMTQFYGGLRRGFDAGHSLSRAMRSVRESPRYSHPYYWAAFSYFVRP
jgi:CHAT domain-containing protein